MIDRRTFLGSLGAAWMASPLAGAAAARRLKVGITSINWGFRPDDTEPGIRDAAKLGYHGYEVFGDNLDPLEAGGGLKRILDQYGMAMPSGYLNINLHDPSAREKQMENMTRWGRILRDCGSHVAVMGPIGVRRDSYNFKEARPHIITTLNEAGKRLADFGLIAALHQHTGTSVDTRDQVYEVMDGLDTRVMKFGPDVGQLLKSGTDPVKVLKDFQPLIRTVHLKDYSGGPHWSGYCPLGQGKVDLPAVLAVLEGAEGLRNIMVELDISRNAPATPIECATTSRQYLEKQGYGFKT